MGAKKVSHIDLILGIKATGGASIGRYCFLFTDFYHDQLKTSLIFDQCL